MHHNKWENLFSEVGECNFTAAKKKPFFTISWHKKTMTNNLHHWRTVFLSLRLEHYQIQIVMLEFLQRCGHQSRMNTWTGSYRLLLGQHCHPQGCLQLHTMHVKAHIFFFSFQWYIHFDTQCLLILNSIWICVGKECNIQFT